MRWQQWFRLTLAAACLVTLSSLARAQVQDDDELAWQLANPLGDLASIPVQENGDFEMGTTGAFRNTLNVQPVYPFGINFDWNAISRTIVPVVFQEEMVPGAGNELGFGDILQSLFFSPRDRDDGLIWGVGPALLIPTATASVLGSGKFGVGPTAIVLVQKEQWTYGALANQIWSFAGDRAREDISAMFLQPFVVRALRYGFTATANMEATRDWLHDTWSVPVNVFLTKVLAWGDKPIGLSGGLRVFLEGPEDGPDWGFRLALTLMYPK